MAFDDEFPNYHIIEDKAYTKKDNVLVYNVFVNNIPIKTTETEFTEYFKRFGDVVSVRLLKGRQTKHFRKSQKVGFVKYKSPLSAAKALQNSFHLINEERIWVRASDSRHQQDDKPTASTATSDATNDDVVKNLNDDCLYEIFKYLEIKDQINLAQCCSRLQDVFADSACAKNYTSLLNLNDYCLDEIFKHLEITDQINMTQCCRRLQDVFVMHAKIGYKFLDLGDLKCLTLCQIQQFFQMAGPHIEKLRVHVSSRQFRRVFEFLGIYCLNVKSVSIMGERLTAPNLWKLFKNMQMVEELQLKNAYLRDECIPVMKKFQKLKILSLKNNSKLTGKYIDGLTTLESLTLFGCKRIRPCLFRKICNNLTGLKHLDIGQCPEIELFDIARYVNNFQLDCVPPLSTLKHLHLFKEVPYVAVPTQIIIELAKFRAGQLDSLAVLGFICINPGEPSSITELRKLKKLICHNNHKFDDLCLRYITQLQDLELLNITNCTNFSDKALLDVVQKCPKLTTLNVSYCKQLNEEFATNVLQLLVSEKKQRDQTKPLKIMAFNSGICRSAVTTTEFESAADLLTISFEYKKDGITDSDLEVSYDDCEEDEYYDGCSS